MKRLTIVFLLVVSSLCEGQKKVQPQFIEFMEEEAHPEKRLSYHLPLYISSMNLDLPLPKDEENMLKDEKKQNPGISAERLTGIKEMLLNHKYIRVVIDQHLFDLLHAFIIRNSILLTDNFDSPGCLVVIDNKSHYLSQNKMQKFYNGLKIELLSKKCYTSILSKIADQFTIRMQ